MLIMALSQPGMAARQTAPPSDTERREAALALIPFDWQRFGYDIVFLPAQHGYRAMTVPSKHQIEIYARPGDAPELLAFDIAHELGHVIDLVQNTSEIRSKWMESRGIDPATPWFGCSRCPDLNTPAGDFAETFALLLLGPKNFAGRIAPRPSKEQVSTLSAFFPKEWFSAQAN